MKLYNIDFQTAMCLEDTEATYIVKSENEPTVKEVETALHTILFSGTIYVESIKEIRETDTRGKRLFLWKIK